MAGWLGHKIDGMSGPDITNLNAKRLKFIFFK